MRYFTAVLALLAALAASVMARAEERFRMAIVPFKATVGVEDKEALMVTELLITRIANSQELVLVDASAAARESATPIEVGTALGVDFVLSGTVSRPERLLLAANMIDVYTGEILLGEERQIASEALDREIGRLARRILNAAAVYARVSLADVDLYIHLQNYPQARRALDLYVRNSGESVETRERSLVINRALAQGLFEEAQRLAEALLYEDAERVINRAVALDPGQVEYAALGEKITAAKQNQQNMELSALLQEAKRLVEQGTYAGAWGLLQVYENRGGGSPEASMLRDRVQKAFELEQSWRDAQRALANRRYEEARTSGRRALEIDPQNEEYKAFLQQVDDRESADRANQRKWEEYKREILSLDPYALFLIKKQVSHFESMSYIHPVVSYYIPADFDTRSHAMSGLELAVELPLLPAFRTRLSFVDLYLLGIGALSLAGVNRDTVDFLTISSEKLFLLDVSAGIGGRLVVLSYALGLSADVSAGFLSINYEERSSSFGVLSRDQESCSVLGYGFSAWAAWFLSERLRLTLQLRTLFLSPMGLEQIENLRVSKVGIGIGYRVISK